VVTTGVLLGPIISVPVGAAVLQAGSAVKAKLELTPKLLSVDLNFSPFSCCTNTVSPRVIGASPSGSNIFPPDGSAVSAADA
jgi:hypothetical protein